METNESIKMTFPNKLSYSFIVQLFVREIAKVIGFSGNQLDQIDIAIEESVSNVMIHASDEENPTFDVICEKIPGGIKIVLKEMGIPFDPERVKKYELTKNLDDLSTSGLGIYLIQKMMDELSFHNLGTQGKETVMIKYVADNHEHKNRQEITSEKQSPGIIITEKIEYIVRGLDEHEAIEVSRCAYKTHGYTFFDDHIYYPERLVEMNRTSEMISAVAVTKDNVFMGHGALLYQYPEDTIAELTFVFVNVEYRGQGALNKLVDYLFQVPKKRELRGIYAYAVTNHIFTQKSMIKFQIKDCGIMLATSPGSWKFKGITDDTSQRISVALGFRYMMPPVQYNLFAPEHHKVMISRLYQNLGSTPNFMVPSADSFIYDRPAAIIKTGVNELEGCAEIFVASYGSDVKLQLRKILQGFCVKQISAINLFLKLEDPLTYWLTAEFEKLGFFFAGILPESRIGDALVLQYLNNVDLDYSKILLVSDVAKELLTYIRERDPNIIS
ncbi:MAG: GNAT family N-acetyltransferase [Bacteroidales bacterium]|jgi:serine/threonine-protein kinase RsbW